MIADTIQIGTGAETTFLAAGVEIDSVQSSCRVLAADTAQVTLVTSSILAEAANPTFPFETVVIFRANRSGSGTLWSGGTTMFAGKRVGPPIKTDSSGQRVTYEFQGPWYDLSQTHYRQMYQGASGLTYTAPEMVLFTSTAVSAGQIPISVGDQIQAILQCLLDAYQSYGMAAPFQYVGRTLASGAINLNTGSTTTTYGSAAWQTGNYAASKHLYTYPLATSGLSIDQSLFSFFLPTFIARPMKCSDAITKCLEMSPRINTWFDYTTTPPTFHATLVDSMTPVTLALWDGTNHKSVSLRRRDDLTVKAVNLLYRVTSNIGGTEEVDYYQDKWSASGSNYPNSSTNPDTGLRVMEDIIDLTGGSVTFSTAHVDVEPVLATVAMGGTTQALKRTWWSSHRGGEVTKLGDTRVRFQDKTGAATTIPDATVVRADTGATMAAADLIAYGLCDATGALVVNKVVSGTVHAWMVRSDGQPVVRLKVHLTAPMVTARYDCLSASGLDTDRSGHLLGKSNSHEEHAGFEVTNATTGTYQTVASSSAGEVAIVGPGGIAQYLYNHLNAPQFDGDYVKVQTAFDNSVTLGNSMNLDTVPPTSIVPWSSMKAQIQEISRDWGRHTTTIKVGVARHLNSGQLVAMLNMFRNRRPWYNPSLRTNNQVGTTGQVDQPLTAGNANTTDGLVNGSTLVTVDYSVAPNPASTTPGTANGKVVIDATHLTMVENLN